MNLILEKIAEDLALPLHVVRDALDVGRHRYKKIRIPKRAGGYRIAIQPAVELKPILQWLKISVLDQMPISEISTAFRRDHSTVKNARSHVNALYSVRVDLRDFFPSIRILDLHAAIAACRDLPDWVHTAEFQEVIALSCFDSQGRLPIGYLTSPTIANVVMYRFDEALRHLVTDKSRFGAAIVTRYADDFVFSTDRRGACAEFVRLFENEIGELASPQLTLNAEKTKYMNRKSGSVLITGLRVRPNGTIGVHANYRDHVRMLLKLYQGKRLREQDVSSLRGHLSHLANSDPELLTKLAFRYFREIDFLRRGDRSKSQDLDKANEPPIAQN